VLEVTSGVRIVRVRQRPPVPREVVLIDQLGTSARICDRVREGLRERGRIRPSSIGPCGRARLNGALGTYRFGFTARHRRSQKPKWSSFGLLRQMVGGTGKSLKAPL